MLTPTSHFHEHVLFYYEVKSVWRRWAKAQRSVICSSFKKKETQEKLIVEQLRAWLLRHPQVETIGFYLPLALEPNVLSLLNAFPEKKWLLPRTGQVGRLESATSLHFHVLTRTAQALLCEERALSKQQKIVAGLLQNTLGVWEPTATTPCWETAIDVLIIPALAMDASGIRLGYGGGFYDRWLAQHTENPPLTIGVCWADCRVPQLPAQPFDVPLNAICCEQGIVKCS
jgi:5-formyltetrahydrofolate cyclo-ligase